MSLKQYENYADFDQLSINPVRNERLKLGLLFHDEFFPAFFFTVFC